LSIIITTSDTPSHPVRWFQRNNPRVGFFQFDHSAFCCEKFLETVFFLCLQSEKESLAVACGWGFEKLFVQWSRGLGPEGNCLIPVMIRFCKIQRTHRTPENSSQRNTLTLINPQFQELHRPDNNFRGATLRTCGWLSSRHRLPSCFPVSALASLFYIPVPVVRL
jgi:hypothetical protein